jgi:hypothetical protein
MKKFNNHNWIPVELRLPKRSGHYLVWFKQARTYAIGLWYRGKWSDLCFTGYGGTETVSHWQELPLPPLSSDMVEAIKMAEKLKQEGTTNGN